VSGSGNGRIRPHQSITSPAPRATADPAQPSADQVLTFLNHPDGWAARVRSHGRVRIPRLGGTGPARTRRRRSSSMQVSGSPGPVREPRLPAIRPGARLGTRRPIGPAVRTVGGREVAAGCVPGPGGLPTRTRRPGRRRSAGCGPSGCGRRRPGLIGPGREIPAGRAAQPSGRGLGQLSIKRYVPRFSCNSLTRGWSAGSRLRSR
jgi:hypothetical protein